MAAENRNGFLLAIRRFARSKRGVSAVEFALILPVMLTLFLGGTEVTQGITIKRKVTIATRTIGDLVAQGTTVNDAEIASIFAATNAVLTPYPTANLKLRVSSVRIDQNNVARIVWSDGHGGMTPRAAGSVVTLPTGLDAFPNTTLIWGEAEYIYTPTIGYVLTGDLALQDRVYMRPRLVTCVKRIKGAQELC